MHQRPQRSSFAQPNKHIYKLTSKMFISSVKWHNLFHLCYIQCTRIVVSVHWFKHLLTFEGKCQYRIWVWVYENVDDSFQNHSFHFVENRIRCFMCIGFFLNSILSYLFGNLSTQEVCLFQPIVHFFLFLFCK